MKLQSSPSTVTWSFPGRFNASRLWGGIGKKQLPFDHGTPFLSGIRGRRVLVDHVARSGRVHTEV